MSSLEDLVKRIDHTNLKPWASEDSIIKTINEARTHKFRGVCIPPTYVATAKKMLENTGVKVITVVGFPLGYYHTEIKKKEAKIAEENGADEIDVVMNISAFKSGKYSDVLDDLKNVVNSVRIPVKVIIETSYLSKDEIIRACKIVEESGAFCVKTNTGFGSRGVSPEDIKIIKEMVGTRLKIKASGGIRTAEQAIQLIKLGADILGTSAGVAILKEYKEKYT